MAVALLPASTAAFRSSEAWALQRAAPAACTIVGTAGSDDLVGTDGDDVICGLEGNDSIHGKAGDDLIFGGPGRDSLHGGSGDDRIVGGPDEDTLAGRVGDDVLRGGSAGTSSSAAPVTISYTEAGRATAAPGTVGRTTSPGGLGLTI